MKSALSALALAAGLLGAAQAQAVTINSISGQYGDLSWTAASTLVGKTSTATLAGGGDPRFFAPMPQYSGVATLIMDFAKGSFICTGSLLPDRRSILTAAHCVSDGTAARPLSTTVFFPTSDPDSVPGAGGASASFSYQVSDYVVHSSYTGKVIDQNDIAVLHLGSWVDASLTAYDLYTGKDLTGQDYNIAGYGGRSDIGGSVGANLGTGRLRQGDNRYDFRLGDADFGGIWDDILGLPAKQIAYSYVADFDSGLAANDGACLIATLGFDLAATGKYCNPGRGETEVSTAGGDSGGPEFIDGMIASVTSYGLSFGKPLGDSDADLNSSFGEINGFVPVFIHEDFIRDNMIPEPGSYALACLGLILLGIQRRRRN